MAANPGQLNAISGTIGTWMDPKAIYGPSESLPRLDPHQLEVYIQKLRAHNYWNELESYKTYLRYCEKNFPEDKVWGYHQKDKWKENLKTFKASPMFTIE